MTYISYLTVQSRHVKQLDEHGNLCYVAANISMIVANLLIVQTYAAHSIVVVIHNLWNLNMNLSLFSPDSFHLDLLLFISF